MTRSAPAWHEIEIAFEGPELENPYLEMEAWADFVHPSGAKVRRPLFWDGATAYRVRFASPEASGTWSWTVRSGTHPGALTPSAGEVSIEQPVEGSAAAGTEPHPALKHGFHRIASEGRAAEYADGTPAFWVADTPWAMPFRAELDDVAFYARDRQAKGFNAALLMVVMPDMEATGPRGRNLDDGFEVAFEDLPQGRLNQINVVYFQYFDAISSTLIDHGLTPILQPVFHGYGWKGQRIAGPEIPPDEYARLCRYLVARYGARPAVYLVCGDGSGLEPGVEAGGREIDEWDAYDQPIGIHFRPHSPNEAHQDALWLDFQSCQTGHDGDHAPDRLARMWANRPVKAIMNAEPTYENSGRMGKATGWWQGNEAWINVCAGGVLGVGYGAGSLWQWRLHSNEANHGEFYIAPEAGWREALAFEGSSYVGLVGKILEGLPLAAASPCWDVLQRARGLLAPGHFFLSYAEHGGSWNFLDADGRIPDRYWVIDPKTAEVVESGIRPGNYGMIPGEDEVPRVLICAEEAPLIARSQPG
jgi:hypothetical protein